MNQKETKLLRLMTKIHRECYDMDVQFKTAWFYPEHNGVKGYLGTSRLIFAGINPSYGTFPSKPVSFLYEALGKSDLQNVHITDIIKSRLSNRQVEELNKDKELHDHILDKNIRWLKQELRILSTSLDVKIVGIGKKAHDTLKLYFDEQVLDIWLHHYAWVERYSNAGLTERRNIFRKDIRSIKKAASEYIE